MKTHASALILAALAASVTLLTGGLARAVVEEGVPQYQQRYGKATHEMNIDASHPGLIFTRKPYVVFAAFENRKSVGEMIFKAGTMSPVDIANILRQNGAGVQWRKENVTKTKGDEEKMRQQGLADLQIWSRTDGRIFATYMRTVTGSGKTRQEMNILLVGNKRGVKLVSDMAQMGKQWTPKPLQ